eukprot:gene14806-20861_t
MSALSLSTVPKLTRAIGPEWLSAIDVLFESNNLTGLIEKPAFSRAGWLFEPILRNTEFDDPSPDIVPPPEVRSLTELERLVGRNPRPEEAPGLRSRGGDVGSSVGTADGGRSVVRPAQQQVDSLPGELSSGLTTPDSDEPASSPMKKFEKVGRDPVESGRRAKLAADLLEQAAAETPLPGTPLPPPSERAFETPSKKEDADAKFATYLAAAIADDPTRAIALFTAMGKTPDRDSEAKRQERGLVYMKALELPDCTRSNGMIASPDAMDCAGSPL